jgi:hypothetical protein
MGLVGLGCGRGPAGAALEGKPAGDYIQASAAPSRAVAVLLR